ncbi:helicase HerA domain-containing protein, partial [Parabacteroides johnsonii]
MLPKLKNKNNKAKIDINKLVTRHSCIVGSTGTGKSTTV